MIAENWYRNNKTIKKLKHKNQNMEDDSLKVIINN